MASERGVHPALREKDIARPLDLGKQLQTRLNEAPGVDLAQRMIQIVLRFEHPWLALAVFRVLEPAEGGLTYRGVGRERGPHEREARSPVRVLDTGVLRMQAV